MSAILNRPCHYSNNGVVISVTNFQLFDFCSIKGMYFLFLTKTFLQIVGNFKLNRGMSREREQAKMEV